MQQVTYLPGNPMEWARMLSMAKALVNNASVSTPYKAAVLKRLDWANECRSRHDMPAAVNCWNAACNFYDTFVTAEVSK